LWQAPSANSAAIVATTYSGRAFMMGLSRKGTVEQQRREKVRDARDARARCFQSAAVLPQ
jgi:hypothetical protein